MFKRWVSRMMLPNYIRGLLRFMMQTPMRGPSFSRIALVVSLLRQETVSRRDAPVPDLLLFRPTGAMAWASWSDLL